MRVRVVCARPIFKYARASVRIVSMDIDAIEIDFGDGGVGILCSGIDIDDGEAYLDRVGAWVGSLFARPPYLTHVEGLLGIDVVEMQRGEFLSVDTDLQLLDAAVLLPCLSGADISCTDTDGGDARIAGG